MSTTPDSLPALSETRLSEIDARADAASAGPWEPHEADDGHKVTLYGPGEYSGNHESHHEWHCDHMLWGEVDADAAQFAEAQADAEFIAHARTDIPDLLAEVRRLQGAIRQHEEDEASVCPEDVGFVEYIRALESQLASAREETAQAVAIRDARRYRTLRDVLRNEKWSDLPIRLAALRPDPDDPQTKYVDDVILDYAVDAAIRSRSLPGETAGA